MNQQAKGLADRLTAFNDEVIAMVEQCSDEDWKATCAEDWTLGVVAYHIAAGHYPVTIELGRMIIAGQPLPELSPEALVQGANDMAREHTQCTKAEVLTLLKENGARLRDYVAGLSSADLQRKTNFALLGGEVTAEQFIEAIVLQSAGEHFTNLKAALSRA